MNYNYTIGGFFFAHVGIFDLYCLSYTCDDDEGSMGRSIAYLKGLEMTGVVDPDIFYLLGSTYYNKTDDALIVETYSQWAIEKGLIRSFIGKGLPELLKAEERGLCHASIYASIISVLIKQQETSTSTDDLVQVRFKQYGTRGGLALHYCEKLISMGSPIGYYWKGEIHYNGLADVVKDCSIAVKTWLEADEQGLATTIMYDQGLADAFSYVMFHRRPFSAILLHSFTLTSQLILEGVIKHVNLMNYTYMLVYISLHTLSSFFSYYMLHMSFFF